MRKPDDAPKTLAKVLDFEQARARRVETHGPQSVGGALMVVQPEPDRARMEANFRRQRERTAEERRRLQERTAQKRAAASKQRIQVRVADRLARIEAELEAEIARLRLAYAERRRASRGGFWMWPTVALSVLALVAGLAYFAGIQQLYAASAVAVPQRVAAKQITKRSVRAGRCLPRPAPRDAFHIHPLRRRPAMALTTTRCLH